MPCDGDLSPMATKTKEKAATKKTAAKAPAKTTKAKKTASKKDDEKNDAAKFALTNLFRVRTVGKVFSPPLKRPLFK